MKMVDNGKEYWEFVRKLRNDPLARANSMNSAEITQEEHHEYMQQNGQQYYICLVEDGLPAGYVRVDSSDYISVAVSPEHRRRGIGKLMVHFVVEKYKGKGKNLYATIRVSNEASINLFKSCGFMHEFHILEQKARPE